MISNARDYYKGDLPSHVGEYALGSFPVHAQAWTEGRSIAIEDIGNDPVLSVGEREALMAYNVKAALSTPLVKNGKAIAVRSALSGAPRSWSPDDIDLLEETADRTWAAVERARAEQALRESEERFRGFAENSSDALWIVDAKRMKLEYLSPAFENIWGIPREEVMADLEAWAHSIHPGDREHAATAMPAALTGKATISDYRIIGPDGRVRFIRDTGFPIRIDGEIRRIGGIAQDLTDLRLAEQESTEGRERLAALIGGIPQLVWRASAPGHWTWASPQWTQYTGQSSADSCGRGWLDKVHPDDRDAALEAWSRADEEGGFEVDYRLHQAASDQYRWFQTRALPLHGDDGEILEWLGTSTDIHHLRELEHHGRILLAELQHRVRNTLGVIRSIARRTAEQAQTVEDFSAHFDGRLSAFGRVQAMVTRNAEGRVSLLEMVEDELVAHAARDGDRVTIDGDDTTLAPRIAERLSLAVHELATNSIKYGALNDGSGDLRVHWRSENSGGGRRLVFSWEETGSECRKANGAKGLGRSC